MTVASEFTSYDEVEGYCGALSYEPGERVTLHTSCRAAVFDVVVERWGAERELVWSCRNVAGTVPPLPADADANGCGWPSAVEFDIPSAWRSGFYLVTMTAAGAPQDRATSFACFVVRAAVPTSPILLVVATNTYNAYNDWGGVSLYTGGKAVSFRRPYGRGMLCRDEVERDDRKSRPVRRGEQPDVDGMIYQEHRWSLGLPGYMASAGWFTYERRFVEWAERAGIALDYAISTDLEDHPGLLDGYRLVVGIGHDEYWSAGGRDAVEDFVRGGGNYASFSGNTMFWQVRFTGDRRDTMVCHKYSAHDTDPLGGIGERHGQTGLWSDPVVGRPESAFLGASSVGGLYARFGMATPRASGGYTVFRDDHWMLDGTALRYGDQLGADDGVVGYETVGCRLAFDEFQLPVSAGGDGAPAGIEVVAWAPSSNLRYGEYPKSITALDDQGDLEFIAERIHGRADEDTMARIRHGNSVMLAHRPYAGGGEVVTVGSTDWVFGLADPCVARVTANVLARLGSANGR